MCGIIGITGRDDAVDGIIAGLTRLEYRGYDSAGVVVRTGDDLHVVKRAGKLDNLKARARADEPAAGRIGIGHTRWATHGAPNDANAHPHLGPTGRVAVVHNGILENYQALRGRTRRRDVRVRHRHRGGRPPRRTRTRCAWTTPDLFDGGPRASSTGSRAPTRCASSRSTTPTRSWSPSTRRR